MRIATTTWIAWVGTVGGFCTTFAYVPQVMKIWKQGGRDLSYGMLVRSSVVADLRTASARRGRYSG
jgi:uncharacterized protein with PQ loop repeat